MNRPQLDHPLIPPELVVDHLRETSGDFVADVFAELRRAEELHAPLNSLHEAYAVILEELDELWEEVRRKRQDRDSGRIRSELVQVAAMCWRAARNLGLESDGRSDDNSGGE